MDAVFLAHLARTKYRLTLDEFDLISVAPYLNQGLSAAQITSAVTEDIFHGTTDAPRRQGADSHTGRCLPRVGLFGRLHRLSCSRGRVPALASRTHGPRTRPVRYDIWYHRKHHLDDYRMLLSLYVLRLRCRRF